MYHSHSYTDPDTGELIDVMIADPDDRADYRNGRDHRGHGGAGFGGHHRPPWQHQGVPGGHGAPGGHGVPGGRGMPDRVIVRHPVPTVPVPGQHTGDTITIPKSAVTAIIPALGQVWASFLGLPEAPHAIGNDVIDRNNAALHRDALATHAQNQTRILALTDLASRALRLML